MIVVEYKLTGIESLSKSQINNAAKRAMLSLGHYWHEAFAWKRFDPIAYSEYGFRPRSRGYNKRKGHNVPLFFTGETADLTLGSWTRSRIRATRDTVRIPFPRKVNLHNPKGPNLPDEIRRVSREEMQVLQEALVVYLEDEIDKEVPPDQRDRRHVRSARLRRFTPARRPSAVPTARRAQQAA